MPGLHTSRRRFLGGLLGATGVAAGMSPPIALLQGSRTVTTAFAANDGSTVDPTPIPGGEVGTHHFLPGRGKEVSTINDFNGFVGIGQLTGTGASSAGPLNFSVDNRFLVGEYLGVDGKLHRSSFGVF